MYLDKINISKYFTVFYCIGESFSKDIGASTDSPGASPAQITIGKIISIQFLWLWYHDYTNISTDATPTLGKLSMIKTEGKKIKIIETVAPKWQKLGDQFEFDECGLKLESIKTKNLNDPEACCREMFQHWLKGSGVRPCSWRKLIELLEDCDFDALAEQVESVFTP